MIKKCLGCGTILQNEDVNRDGYVLDITKDYCKRCFRLMHYNELPKVFATNKEFLEVINVETKRKNLFVYIIDIFSFPISFNKEIIDILRDKDVILVVNKIDLLPKSFNIENILEFVSKECQKVFFKVIAIHLISAKKGYYLKDLMHNLNLFRRERDICILGLANVGKSSFINAILKDENSSHEDIIASSIVPGTTLQEIKIPFYLDNRGFIDTPGLISDESVLSHIDNKYYHLVLPEKEIKAITYQLHGNYSYFIGGLCYLEFDNPTNVSLVIYKANNLEVHRVKNENIDNAIAKVGNSFIPACNIVKFNKEEIKVNKRKTIFIGGFTMIEVIGNTNFNLYYNEGLGVKTYDNVFTRRN